MRENKNSGQAERPMTRRESLFCELYVRCGGDGPRAFAESAKDADMPVERALRGSRRLLSRERVRRGVSAAEQRYLAESCVTPALLIAQFREIADDGSASRSDRIRALENMARLAGLWREPDGGKNICFVAEGLGGSEK